MPPPLLRSRYALVYGHDFPAWAGEAARDWARRQGLRLLSVGYRADFADEQWLEAGPWGFASAVAGAAAMITTMFHGTIFALNTQLPFVAVPSAYRADKLADLADHVGAAAHLASAPDQISPALDRGFDPGVVRTIAVLRESSDAVLAEALA
jgi:hypothetical protein